MPQCEMCAGQSQGKQDMNGLPICDECWPHLVADYDEIAPDDPAHGNPGQEIGRKRQRQFGQAITANTTRLTQERYGVDWLNSDGEWV